MLNIIVGTQYQVHDEVSTIAVLALDLLLELLLEVDLELQGDSLGTVHENPLEIGLADGVFALLLLLLRLVHLLPPVLRRRRPASFFFPLSYSFALDSSFRMAQQPALDRRPRLVGVAGGVREVDAKG